MNLVLSGLLCFLCCFFSLAEILEKKGSKFLCAILVVLFVYVVAERNINVVPDSSAYVEVYERVRENISEANTYFEKGYIYFNYFIGRFGFNYRIFLAACALVPSLVYLWAMSILVRSAGGKRMFWCVFFSVYCCFWGLVGNGLTLRIGLAVSFAFLGHAFWIQKKLVPSVLMFWLATTFHASSIVYPIFLFVSQKVNMKQKSFGIYMGFVVLLYLLTVNGMTRFALHWIASRILILIAKNISFLSHYAYYIGGVSARFDSRKNILFMIMLLVFIVARPKSDKYYDQWLKFFAFNMAVTFPLSVFGIGFRVTDVCIISALPLLTHCMYSPKFTIGLKISVLFSFIVSLFIFSLRMTRVY